MQQLCKIPPHLIWASHAVSASPVSASLPTFTSLLSPRDSAPLCPHCSAPACLSVSGSLALSLGASAALSPVFLLPPASPLSKPPTLSLFLLGSPWVSLLLQCICLLSLSPYLCVSDSPSLPQCPHLSKRLCVLAWVSHSPSLSLPLSLGVALPCTSISPGLHLVAPCGSVPSSPRPSLPSLPTSPPVLVLLTPTPSGGCSLAPALEIRVSAPVAARPRRWREGTPMTSPASLRPPPPFLFSTFPTFPSVPSSEQGSVSPARQPAPSEWKRQAGRVSQDVSGRPPLPPAPRPPALAPYITPQAYTLPHCHGPRCSHAHASPPQAEAQLTPRAPLRQRTGKG